MFNVHFRFFLRKKFVLNVFLDEFNTISIQVHKTLTTKMQLYRNPVHIEILVSESC